ncbi:hypothetical protein DPMN_171543 [Dreissena polymorpha]|uniref:Uncharacterized protein n=1 Tax=Dreissena polymorpha TaxID=45954 RepID=A0A9D4DY73_DREPO|nr:hypothetical protein DPMN_171543 [Dreissena polymorpha]
MYSPAEKVGQSGTDPQGQISRPSVGTKQNRWWSCHHCARANYRGNYGRGW